MGFKYCSIDLYRFIIAVSPTELEFCSGLFITLYWQPDKATHFKTGGKYKVVQI